MVDILELVRTEITDCSLKNSFQFAELFKERGNTGLKIASLDIAYLFTNVLSLEKIDHMCYCNEVKEITLGTLFGEIKEFQLRGTLNNQFSFNTKHYQQSVGDTMGSSLGSLIANVFVARLENGVLQDTIGELPAYL